MALVYVRSDGNTEHELRQPFKNSIPGPAEALSSSLLAARCRSLEHRTHLEWLA